MTKLSKFRLSSTSRQVTWVRFHWNYIFISNFSYRKARQLASKIVSALSEQNISQASYFENSLFRIKQLTMFAAQEVLYWFRVINVYITIQSNQSNCNSIKRSCAAGCQHRFYKCMYVWINSSHCCTIGTSARPNLAPTRFTTVVRTFALWWHSKGKYISHFIAETAARNCPIPLPASSVRWIVPIITCESSKKSCRWSCFICTSSKLKFILQIRDMCMASIILL